MYGVLPEVTLPSGQVVRGLTIRVPNPPKTAVISLPTDEQVVSRLDAGRVIRRDLGRGKVLTTNAPNRGADSVLFEYLRLDDGLEFDEFEATEAISRVFSVLITDSKQVGDAYAITMETPFGDVKHVFCAPSMRDIQTYRRNVATSVSVRGALEELRTHVLVGCELYDRTIVSIEGYADDFIVKTVPPHHKAMAVSGLVEMIG